jgi:GntR family transcriptional regulator, colanic acid and biofilm gene transcriptional regulator
MATPLTITKIDQGNLSVRAYATLREGLISGKFRPGQRLVMQDLANYLGTSITPVREACLRLVSEKGLELRAGRFAQVPQMTYARYIEVRTIRLALEGLATELAAQHAAAADIARLRAIDALYGEHDRSGDADEAFRHNRDFHFGVYRLCGSEMLVDQIENLWLVMGPMLTLFFREGYHDLIASAEHETALAALEVGDGKAARIAIERDIILGGNDLLRFLSERESDEDLPEAK